MAYQMKRALRNTLGTKSYAQLQQEVDIKAVAWQLKERQKEKEKKSIFQNKNWNTKQKVKLMIFLSYYHGLPDWLSERRSIHLYKHLSTFLKKSRTPEQCKNIHSLLKRKFPNLESVLRAMISELSAEINYEKLVAKYQKDIQRFQAQNSLLDAIVKQGYEPLISCFQAEGKAKRSVGGHERGLQGEDDLKFNLNEYIKCQQKNEERCAKNRREQLGEMMSFYFKEWVKCMCVIQQLEDIPKE